MIETKRRTRTRARPTDVDRDLPMVGRSRDRPARAAPIEATDPECSRGEQETFMRDLAHEVRTPIAQLSGIAQLLLDRFENGAVPDLASWLRLQLKVTQRMGQMVQGLLDLAHDDEACGPAGWVDLTAVCAELSQETQHLQRRAPVQWVIQPLMRVRANPARVELLMRNLLSNAAKYTRDVEFPRVVIEAENCEGGLRVRVRDNGRGFDEAEAQRLFHPFVRLHGSEQFDGVGLGLSLVRRLMEREGGWVRAHGVRGRGATFELHFYDLGDGTQTKGP